MNRTATMNARVRVPASTSNLGGGFDCVGVAVDRWLTGSVVASDDRVADHVAVTMHRSGSVATVAQPPELDLVHVGFTLACEARKRPVPKRVDYDVSSTIPVARGLGSSAAALVAGAMLANEALALDLAREEIAALCARTEGHPDNVGAAVFGGAVLGVTLRGEGRMREYSFSSLLVHPDIALVFVVPDFDISTSAARAILPATVPYATAVAAIAKGAALVQGLATRDATLLTYALEDVIHVPYRRDLIPSYAAVVDAAAKAGAFGGTLSGSGSTIVALAPHDAASRVAAAMQRAWPQMNNVSDVIVAAEPTGGAISERAER